MILLDTTVLVYAVGEPHRLREPCRRIIERIAEGQLAATTTVEVIQEFAHVRARRRGRPDSVRKARAYSTLLAPLTVVTERDLNEGLRMFELLPHLGAFDAVLAAAALGGGLEALVSTDRAFSTVPGLRHVVPSAPEAEHLLR